MRELCPLEWLKKKLRDKIKRPVSMDKPYLDPDSHK